MNDFETWKAEILKLSEEEQHRQLDMIATIWELDWDFIRSVYICQNATDDDLDRRRKEYYENCRKTFKEHFNYVPWLFDDRPTFTSIPKATYRLENNDGQDH
jgi:hypothetical protein